MKFYNSHAELGLLNPFGAGAATGADSSASSWESWEPAGLLGLGAGFSTAKIINCFYNKFNLITFIRY